MTAISSAGETQRESRRRLLTGVAGIGVLAVAFVLGLAWAKWIPYAHKADRLSVTHAWPGHVLFAHSGAPGTAPTLAGSWHFAAAYFTEVWEGFLAALVIAAVLDALVPRAWLLKIMNRRTRLGQAAAGGVAALPSLMCTCCTSPLVVGLRRRGASATASLAYWLANPLLNPAVLVFLFLVAPWQFGVVRIVIGVAIVTGGPLLVTRLLPRVPADDAVPAEPRREQAVEDPASLTEFPVRFARSFARLAIFLIPAYVAVVLLLGCVSGWLSDFSGLDARLGIIAVLLCAFIGTLLVIPTGGEIPVVLALTAAGASAATAGALLITLPALSLPSMVMVGRSLSWRVTAATAATVTAAGLAAAALLWALT